MKFKLNIILILLLILNSCSNDSNNGDENNNNESRFKFTFTHSGSGVIIGDTSNEIIKKFSFSDWVSDESKYYHNENTNNIYITWVQDNGTIGKVLSQNIIDIYNYDGNNSFIESEVMTLPNFPNEKIIDIVVDANENILAFNASTDTNTGNDILIIRKINNNNSEVMLTIQFNDTYYIWENLHLLSNTNEVLYFNTSSDFPILIDLASFTYQSLNTTTNIEHCGSVVFGSAQQKYLIDLNNSGTGPHSQTLYTFNGENQGSIFEEGIFDLYFIGCYASIGYDNVDSQFEYLLRSDGRSSVGELNVNTFGLIEESIIGDTYNLNYTGNPLFFFSIN